MAQTKSQLQFILLAHDYCRSYLAVFPSPFNVTVEQLEALEWFSNNRYWIHAMTGVLLDAPIEFVRAEIAAKRGSIPVADLRALAYVAYLKSVVYTPFETPMAPRAVPRPSEDSHDDSSSDQ